MGSSHKSSLSKTDVATIRVVLDPVLGEGSCIELPSFSSLFPFWGVLVDQ